MNDIHLIEYLKPSQIRRDPNNVYTHEDADIQRLVHSIQEHGFLEPLVVDAHSKTTIDGEDNYELVGGEARLEAATICNLPSVPCTIATFRTPDHRAAAAVALNGKYGTFDTVKLTELLVHLDEMEIDLDDTGLAPFEIEALMPAPPKPEGNTDPDAVPAPPKVPITKPGDLIILGRHKVLCGDATVASDIDRLMGNDQADMIWTDPPYGVNHSGGTKDPRSASYRSGDTMENDALSPNVLEEFLRNSFGNAFSACKPGGVWYVAAPAGPQCLQFAVVLTELKVWRQLLCWVKDSFVFGRSDYHYRHETLFYGWKEGAAHNAVPDRKQDTVWEFDRPKSSEDHPTMKPVALVERSIENSSKKQEIVLDLFGGSGTTLLAAERTGRTARLLELDPKFVDVIVQRWEEHTGETAERPQKAA